MRINPLVQVSAGGASISGGLTVDGETVLTRGGDASIGGELNVAAGLSVRYFPSSQLTLISYFFLHRRSFFLELFLCYVQIIPLYRFLRAELAYLAA